MTLGGPDDFSHSYRSSKSDEGGKSGLVPKNKGCHKKKTRPQFFLKTLFLLREIFKSNLETSLRRNIDSTYLIFVISFTQAGFLNSKVLHPKTTQNTHKLQQIPQKDVKYAVICVQSGKFYTGQNFFTRAPPVVPVTNMRYAHDTEKLY